MGNSDYRVLLWRSTSKRKLIMPMVNGKKYAYTKEGMKKAAEAKKKMMAKKKTTKKKMK